MISYALHGAWGKDIPDEELTKALLDFGIELKVEARKDGLSNVNIDIDDEKILKRKKGTPRRSKAASGENNSEKKETAEKTRTKKASTKRTTKK